VGDELVTSSYDGGAFPGGIPIGAVAEVGDTATRLSQDVQIRPFVNFTRLDHLLIVIQRPVEDIPPLDEMEDEEVFERPDVDATLAPEEVEGAPEQDDGDDDEGDG
jgi:cell shape-determining protein MreC